MKSLKQIVASFTAHACVYLWLLKFVIYCAKIAEKMKSISGRQCRYICPCLTLSPRITCCLDQWRRIRKDFLFTDNLFPSRPGEVTVLHAITDHVSLNGLVSGLKDGPFVLKCSLWYRYHRFVQGKFNDFSI